MSLEAFYTIYSLAEVSFSPTSVMDFGFGSVDRDLDPIATSCASKKFDHFVSNEGPIAQEFEPHLLCYDALNQFFEIFPHEGLPSGKGDIHDSTTIQLFKELDPLGSRQIFSHVTWPGEVVAVLTTQIASVGNVNVNRPWRVHHFHFVIKA
jgi:hypothetical protein